MKCPRSFQGAEEKWGEFNIIQKVNNPLWITKLQESKTIHTYLKIALELCIFVMLYLPASTSILNTNNWQCGQLLYTKANYLDKNRKLKIE